MGKKRKQCFFFCYLLLFVFMGLPVIPLAGRAEVRAIPHKQTKSELSLKLLTKNCMVTIFVLNKFIPKSHESYNLLSGRLDVHLTTLAFVIEGIMALQEMIDKKNHIFVYLVDFVRLQILQFLQGHAKKSLIL